MHLYLIRHGESKPKELDPERSLTDKGVMDVEKIGAFIEEHIYVNVKKIYQSTKMRSHQTAKILAMYIEPPDDVETSENLDPMADPKKCIESIESHQDDIIVAGHLPHLSKLASFLICGDENQEIIDFQEAGLVCLLRDNTGKWKVRWMITPEVLK